MKQRFICNTAEAHDISVNNTNIHVINDTITMATSNLDAMNDEDANTFLLEEEQYIKYPSRAPLFSELNDDEQGELWAALALRHTEGLGARSHGKLVQHFGSAFNAVQAAPNWNGLGIAESKAQLVYQGVWRESAHKEWRELSQSDIGIILWTSPQYPILLRHIYDPPVLLYCKGDTSLLSNATISIVGSRLCSREGRRVAQNIAGELSRVGITVVSGMAKGVDAIAHYAALQGIGKSIGVLGTGLDICYPYENKKLYKDIQEEGLLVSEFSLGMRALPQNFPARNRIVSGLSLGVLIVEAAARSGSLITARLALEQNREVYAVPGPITMQQYSGCHELIRQGAHPVFHVDDILRDLASPLHHQLENAPCLNVMRKRRRTMLTQQCAEDIILMPERVTADSDQTEQVGGEQIKGVDSEHIECSAAQTTAPVKHVNEAEKSADDLQILIAYIKNNQEVHIDSIAQNVDIPTAKISSMLLILEMSGQVRRLTGMRYMLVKEA